jgi:hypothetical protein
LGSKARERVRCSPLIDLPIYPRLKGTMQGSERARNSAARAVARLVSFGCRRGGEISAAPFV